MKVSELLQKIDHVDGDALVYMEADHGQMPECAGSVVATTESPETMPYYGEDLDWVSIEEVPDDKKITAIKIF